MEILYRWRVQQKDRRGKVRWRLIRSPMTEDTARFWAANNHQVIERVAAAPARQGRPGPAPETAAGTYKNINKNK